MSRTFGHGTGHKYNGTKYQSGIKFSSKRPGSRDYTPCKSNKRLVHKIERAINKALIYNYAKVCDE